MSLLAATARRAKRAVTRREPHSLIEVHRIVRATPWTWVATVEYTYGRASWTEPVSFTRKRSGVHDVITVMDENFPTDRKCVFIAPRGTDMPSLIVSYLIAGRW